MTRLRPAITGVLVVSLATALLGIPSVALAQDQPSLAVPDAGSRDADRALVTDDGPRIGPDVFDVDAAGEAALDQVDLFVDADWDLAVLAEELGSEPEAAFVRLGGCAGRGPGGLRPRALARRDTRLRHAPGRCIVGRQYPGHGLHGGHRVRSVPTRWAKAALLPQAEKRSIPSPR